MNTPDTRPDGGEERSLTAAVTTVGAAILAAKALKDMRKPPHATAGGLTAA